MLISIAFWSIWFSKFSLENYSFSCIWFIDSLMAISTNYYSSNYYELWSIISFSFSWISFSKTTILSAIAASMSLFPLSSNSYLDLIKISSDVRIYCPILVFSSSYWFLFTLAYSYLFLLWFNAYCSSYPGNIPSFFSSLDSFIWTMEL